MPRDICITTTFRLHFPHRDKALASYKKTKLRPKNVLQHWAQITTLSDSVLKLDSALGTLSETMALLDKLPLGTIIAWNQLDVDSHPLNWVECDGREIQNGPWMGKTTPGVNIIRLSSSVRYKCLSQVRISTLF
jgi:hypothetical protein